MNIQENKLIDILGQYRCSTVEMDNLNEIASNAGFSRWFAESNKDKYWTQSWYF